MPGNGDLTNLCHFKRVFAKNRLEEWMLKQEASCSEAIFFCSLSALSEFSLCSSWLYLSSV